MAVGTTAAIIGGSLVGAGLIGQKQAADKAAQAAQDAATAQQREANKQYEDQRRYASAAIDAAQSPQELAALDRALRAQEQAVQRQQKFVEAIDPAVLESSKQILDLLRGQEAASLGPIRQQRQVMRDQLLGSLRAQLGPGAETSSIGQNAIQKFDLETNQLMSGAQQQTLGQLLGVAQGGAQFGAGLNSANAGLLGVASGFRGRASGILGAQTAASDIMHRAGMGVLQSAGANYAGAQAEAQGASNLFRGISQVGGTVLGAGLAGNIGKGGVTMNFGNLFGSSSPATQDISGGSYNDVGNIA